MEPLHSVKVNTLGQNLLTSEALYFSLWLSRWDPTNVHGQVCRALRILTFMVRRSFFVPMAGPPGGAQGARAVVLLGGNGSSVESLLGRYPRLPADKLLHVTLDTFLSRYDALYRCVGGLFRIRSSEIDFLIYDK